MFLLIVGTIGIWAMRKPFAMFIIQTLNLLFILYILNHQNKEADLGSPNC